MVCTEDPKKSIGLWHGIMAVSCLSLFFSPPPPPPFFSLSLSFLPPLSTQYLFILYLLSTHTQAAYNGLHVVFVPPSVMSTLPTVWLHMITKHKGRRVPLSRDRHVTCLSRSYVGHQFVASYQYVHISLCSQGTEGLEA